MSIAAIPIGPTLAALALGVVLGLAHFHSLRWATDAFVEGRAARAILLQVVRLALLGACLFGAALAGPWPLFGMAVGIFIGRAAIMRREKRSHG